MTHRARTPILLLAALASLAACVDRRHPTAPDAAGDDGTAARTAPPALVGDLELCKEAGGGIATGARFDFTVALTQVVRTVELAAGGCIRLAVPRDGAALSKGGLRTRAELRASLLPAGSALQVAGAALGAAEVQAVLDAPAKGGPSVDVGGDALLLNLVQQLVAAELNVLRGVQPPPQVASAIAAAGAGLQIDVVGPGQLRIVSTLSTSETSALVDVLSRFNEGKLKGAATPPVAQLEIVEAVPAGVLLDAIVCAPAASCASADLGAGSVTASVTTDGTTRVTFRNRHATLATLRLCKVAGAGIAAGTAFTFDVAGDEVVAEADEGCTDVVLPPENAGDSDGRYGVSEYGCGALCLGDDDGFAVVSIVCAPADRCGSASTGVGTVRVGLAAGEFTTVTFTNRSSIGTLRLCKVGGAGIAAGTSFRFQVTSLDDVFVAAGACVERALPDRSVDSDGRYGIFEYGCGEQCLGTDAGFVVTSIVCVPADRCPSPSLGVGTVRAGLVGGETTTVTFTNRSAIGTLRLCKVAGSGIASGQAFGFNIGSPDAIADPVVPAGGCVDVPMPEGRGEYGDGWYRVDEKGCGPQCALPDLGFVVSAIACVPAERCRNASLALGLVDFAIVAAETTTITYTNRSAVGTLRLCKAAGTGITTGRSFTFSVSTVGDVVVSAGSCVNLSLPEVNAGDSDGRYGVAEYGCGTNCLAPNGGFVVESIVCDPVALCSSLSEGVGSVRVGLVGAQTTTVTFTNRTFAPD